MRSTYLALGVVLLAFGEAVCDEPSATEGLAANYPGDAGIADDADVIFADDFESWQVDGAEPPRQTWSVRKNNTSRTRTLSGRIDADGPGERVLEIACWTLGSGSQTGGLSLKLGNYNHAREKLGDGYDELYLRYYIKFDDNYRSVRNHGANLGGRDVTMQNAAWVGMAAIRDVSSRGYFFSGVQPRGERGSRDLEMGFYSYHLDKRDQWGANYEPLKRVVIKPGAWHCVERRMKLNSVDPKQDDPAVADGVEELWIDGELTIRKSPVRFRRVEHLKITYFTLETYTTACRRTMIKSIRRPLRARRRAALRAGIARGGPRQSRR